VTPQVDCAHINPKNRHKRKEHTMPEVKTIEVSPQDSIVEQLDTGRIRCVSLLFPSGRRWVAFAEDDFAALHAAFQDEEFCRSLRKSVEEYNSGKIELLKRDELKGD
jgi:hypothetical protein